MSEKRLELLKNCINAEKELNNAIKNITDKSVSNERKK